MRFSLGTFVIFIAGASSCVVSLALSGAWRETYSNSSIGNGLVSKVGFSSDDAFLVIDDGNVRSLSTATFDQRVFDASEVDALLAIANYTVLLIGHDGKLRIAKANAANLQELELEDYRAYLTLQASCNSKNDAISLMDKVSDQCYLWSGNGSQSFRGISLSGESNFRIKPSEDGSALIALSALSYQTFNAVRGSESGKILHKRGAPLADFLWLDRSHILLCLYESGQVDCYSPGGREAVFSENLKCLANFPGFARATKNGERVAVFQPNSTEIMLLDFRDLVSAFRIPINGLIASGDLNARGDRICVGLHGGEFCIMDAVSGKQVFRERVSDDDVSYSRMSPSGDIAVCFSRDRGLVLFKRRYPESWWGQFFRPEFWLTVVFGIALILSLRRDWKTLRGKKVEAKAVFETKSGDA